MTIREAIAEQLKSIKNRSPKEQLSYFWEYYGIKTICLLLALAMLIGFIVTMATKKEYAFTGVFFGASRQAGSEDYLTQLGLSCGIDTDRYALSVQCHPDIRMDLQLTPEIYDSMQAFTAMVSANSVDCFAGNAELFLYYSYLGYAMDLRTVLTEAELEQLAPYLYYIDADRIRQQEESNEGYASAYSGHPDPTKPETMVDPIPVGISLDAAAEDFRQAYSFVDHGVIGICASSEHTEYALAILRSVLL